MNATSETIQSREAKRFLEYWRGLSPGGGLPSSSDFLGRPDPTIHPHCFVHEVHEDGRIIPRMIGSAVVDAWGDDLTGQDLTRVMNTGDSNRFFKCLQQATFRPCGYWDLGIWTSPKGHSDHIEITAMPLAVADGKVKRLAGICRFQAKGWADSNKQGHFQLVAAGWIDVGSGVPKKTPKSL